MSDRTLILTHLRKALGSLVKVTKLSKDDIVRDATIQRFEYTYELAWKMIKRHLEWLGSSGVEGMSRRELFREASRVGIIADAEKWFEFHNARNQTSHTYNESAAEEVYRVAVDFVSWCEQLLMQLERHHGRQP